MSELCVAITFFSADAPSEKEYRVWSFVRGCPTLKSELWTNDITEALAEFKRLTEGAE